MNMNFHLTDQRKQKINSVQSIPMKHCAEYKAHKERNQISSESKRDFIPF